MIKFPVTYLYNNRISGKRSISSLGFQFIKVADKRLGTVKEVSSWEERKIINGWGAFPIPSRHGPGNLPRGFAIIMQFIRGWHARLFLLSCLPIKRNSYHLTKSTNFKYVLLQLYIFGTKVIWNKNTSKTVEVTWIRINSYRLRMSSPHRGDSSTYYWLSPLRFTYLPPISC